MRDDSSKPTFSEQSLRNDSSKPTFSERSLRDDSSKPTFSERSLRDDSSKPTFSERSLRDDSSKPTFSERSLRAPGMAGAKQSQFSYQRRFSPLLCYTVSNGGRFVVFIALGLSLFVSVAFSDQRSFVEKFPQVLPKWGVCQSGPLCIGPIRQPSGVMGHNGVSADDTTEWRACPQNDNICPTASECWERRNAHRITELGNSVYSLNSESCTNNVCLHVNGERVLACPAQSPDRRFTTCAPPDGKCIALQSPNQPTVVRVPGEVRRGLATVASPSVVAPSASSTTGNPLLEHRIHPTATSSEKSH